MKTTTIRRVAEILEKQLADAAMEAVDCYESMKQAEAERHKMLPVWKKEWEWASAELERARVCYVDFMRQDWEGSSLLTEGSAVKNDAARATQEIIERAKARWREATDERNGNA